MVLAVGFEPVIITELAAVAEELATLSMAEEEEGEDEEEEEGKDEEELRGNEIKEGDLVCGFCTKGRRR